MSPVGVALVLKTSGAERHGVRVLRLPREG